MSKTNITWFEKIALTRRRRGLSQTDLAEQAGLSRATISLIERGKCDPTLSTLDALTNVLKITIRIRPGKDSPE